MSFTKIALAALLAGGLPALAAADVLMLKDGQALTGTFEGADQNSVSFTVNGKLQKYELTEVNSITFTSDSRRASTPPPAPAPAYATGRDAAPASTTSSSAAATTTSRGVTIAAGTLLTVRMVDGVDSETNEMGQTFRATLDEPLVVGTETIAPRGADLTAKLVAVEQAGRIRGRSELSLVLLDITIDGRKYEITTSEVAEAGSSRGASTAKRVGGTAAVGAIIGGIFGGGKGAAQGAAAGAGAATAVQVLTRGEQVKIPAESRLVFTLANPLRL